MTDHQECPACDGTGEITIIENRHCDMQDCDAAAIWQYENPYSGASWDFCADHLASRREGVTVSDWVSAGFARRIKPEAPYE